VRVIKAFIIGAIVVNHSYFQSLTFEEFYVGGCPMFVKREWHFSGGAVAVGILACDPHGEKPGCSGIANAACYLIEIRNRFAYS